MLWILLYIYPSAGSSHSLIICPSLRTILYPRLLRIVPASDHLGANLGTMVDKESNDACLQ